MSDDKKSLNKIEPASQVSLDKALFSSNAITTLVLAIPLIALTVFLIHIRLYDQADAVSQRVRADTMETIKGRVDEALTYALFMEKQLDQRAKDQVKQHVLEAHKIATAIYQQSKGKLSETALKKTIIEALRPARFDDGRGYYFVASFDGVMQLLADRPEFEGKNLLALKDEGAQPLMQDMIHITKTKGEGFYEYQWTKPNTQGAHHRKVSFLKRFEPFDWFIGAGIYSADVEDNIKKEVLNRIGSMRWGDDGYLFVFQEDGLYLQHAQAKYIGQNLLHIQDPNGVRINERLVQVAKSGGGFQEYSWDKYSTGKLIPKISYAQEYKPWGWVIGSGAYVEDIQARQASLAADSRKATLVSTIALALLAMTSLLVSLKLSGLFRRKVNAQIQPILAFLRAKPDQRVVLDHEKLDYLEMKTIAEASVQLDAAHKAATLAMTRAQKRLETILWTASDGIHILDTDGTLVEANASFLNMLGYDKDVVGHLKVFDWDVLLTPDLIRERLTQLAERQEKSTFETKHKRRDGRIIDVEICTCGIEIDGTQFLYAASRDISERKRAEDALRQSEKRFRSYFELPLIGIAITSLEKGWLDVNQRLCEILGYSKEELADVTWMEITHPDDIVADVSQFERVLSGEIDGYSLDKRFIRKNARVIYAATSVRCVRKDTGEPDYFVALVQDITESKLAQQQLCQRERDLDSILNNMPSMIGYWDKNLRNRFGNHAYATWFGIDADKMQGMLIQDVLGEDIYRLNLPYIEAALRGEEQVFERAIPAPDGKSTLYALAHYIPDIVDDKVAGFYVLVSDISSVKLAQTELENYRDHLENLVTERTAQLERAKEAAEAANVTKDVFLANMSHELRTPLNAVIGMAGLAKNLTVEPKLSDYLNKIVTSGKHLNRIINDLLDLSKIAADRMEFEHTAFSLRSVLDHCKSVMAHRADEKGIELVTRIDDTAPDTMLGDPGRLEQILLNLIGNAIKFTSTGHVVTRISLHAKEENRVCLDFAVEDSGIGMRPEELDRLFQAFTQADATVSRKYGGTGLGLTISKRLAKMMGGDISVTSQEGVGTTFRVKVWFELGNAAELTIPGNVADQEPPQSYHDVRLLVAEDQPLNREIVEALLGIVGITPRMAENGQEALDILLQAGPGTFDLVLMDIQMPFMDGLTATRTVRSWAEFSSLPIIGMTAHTMEHEKKVGADAGMNDHIGKPFDNFVFYRTLAKWIPKEKQQTHQASEHLQPQATATNDLGRLRGVDIMAGLDRFGGKEHLYRKWLAEFVATAGEIPDKIWSELDGGYPDKAAKTVHAFKGRVGMLGMMDLHGVVSAFEESLNTSAPLNALFAELTQSIGQLREQLRTVLHSPLAIADDETRRLETITWKAAYSVGVTELDQQHKNLIEMINRLADCHAQPNTESSTNFHELLSEMFDYTQIHFKAEEDYMRRIQYPGLDNHIDQHQGFVEEATAFNLTAADGSLDMIGMHRYLSQWLIEHIVKSDGQYRRFLEECDSNF